MLAKLVVAMLLAHGQMLARDRDAGARCAAHVPRVGLCPPLLLYFAMQRAPPSRSITKEAAICRRTSIGSIAGGWGAL